jgi:hypothetical protein
MINPAADRPLSAVPDASLDQLDAALPAAGRAFGAWGTDEQRYLRSGHLGSKFVRERTNIGKEYPVPSPVRAEDLLPDDQNSAEINGTVVRKDTAAAFLANARTLSALPPGSPDREPIIEQLRGSARALCEIGLFDVLELRSRELAGLIGLTPEPRSGRSPRWCAISMVRMLDPFGIKELVQSGMVAVGRGGRTITDRAPLVTIDPGGCACKRTGPSVMVMSGMTRKLCRPFGQG